MTLLFILIVFWVYQLISVSVRNREIQKLQDEIAYYQELIESGNLSIDEVYTARWWIESSALELGMKYPGYSAE